MTQYLDSSAVIDGQFRYRLARRWREGPGILWIMLNPSTADGHQDDPTIRRVVGFSERFGYGRAAIVNLFALRSPSPQNLLAVEDPVGPQNDLYLSEALLEHDAVVCAWGAVHPKLRWRPRELHGILSGHQLHCLGMTQRGDPRHPLYLANQTQLVGWPRKP